MIDTSEIVKMLELTSDDILQAISQYDFIKKQLQEAQKRNDALVYMYEAKLTEAGKLQKEKDQLEQKMQNGYDQMRLQLMLENVELKSRLYDELLRNAQSAPVLRVITPTAG